MKQGNLIVILTHVAIAYKQQMVLSSQTNESHNNNDLLSFVIELSDYVFFY